MTKQMVSLVEIKTSKLELKTIEQLNAKIKEVSIKMKEKQQNLKTMPPEIWKLKLKLHDEFQVEESSFFSVSAADGFAIKMYKSMLRDITQQPGLDDDLLDLEEQRTKLVKEREEKELDYKEERLKSKKRLTVAIKEKSVPTSVRKQRRRGEGGVSATMSTTSAISDNLSFDSSELE
jgi:hypothetical protein